MGRITVLLIVFTLSGCSFVSSIFSPKMPEPTGGITQVSTAYSTQFDAYVSGPEKAKYGVLIIPDRQGLNKHIIRWADRFAGRNYVSLALDLYDGRSIESDYMERTVIKSIDPVWTDANLRGALKFLLERSEKVVCVGWGAGAEYGVTLTLDEPDKVSATIAYYTSPVDDVEKLGQIKGPVLGVFVNTESEIIVGGKFDAQTLDEAWEATEAFLSRSFEY